MNELNLDEKNRQLKELYAVWNGKVIEIIKWGGKRWIKTNL